MNVIIIGSGLAAWRAARIIADAGNHRITMVAPNGGLMEGFRGYDKGGHVYGPGACAVARRHGVVIDSEPIVRNAFYYDRSWQRWPYPVQTSMGAEANPFPDYEGQSLESVGRHAFGDAFYESWFAPFNRRVWGLDPSEMDSNWMISRVPTASDSKSWGPNSEFRWVPSDTILRQVMFQSPNMTRTTGVLRGIRATAKGIDTEFLVGSSTWRYDGQHAVINTAPLTQFMRMFSSTRRKPDVPRLPVTYMRTYGVTTNEPYPYDQHNHPDKSWTWAYGAIGEPVHRVTNFSAYTREDKMLGKFLFEVPITVAATNFHPPQESGEVALSSIPYPITDAMQALGIRTTSIVHVAVQYHIGYPTPILGVQQTVANAKEVLASHGVFTCGRWGSHGYFNIDGVLEDAAAAARETLDFLDNREHKPRTSYLNSTHYYQEPK